MSYQDKQIRYYLKLTKWNVRQLQQQQVRDSAVMSQSNHTWATHTSVYRHTTLYAANGIVMRIGLLRKKMLDIVGEVK